MEKPFSLSPGNCLQTIENMNLTFDLFLPKCKAWWDRVHLRGSDVCSFQIDTNEDGTLIDLENVSG